jgi:hypothetical protein
VIRSAAGSVGSHFASGSSSETSFRSTNWSSSVERYEKATAPLRKCISGVAGTPVIDSPNASVSNSRPSIVTRTMAAFSP